MNRKRYVLTEDIYAVFSQIQNLNSTNLSPHFQKAVDRYLKSVKNILAKPLGKNTTIELYSKSNIENIILNSVISILNTNKKILCVCLDRNMLFNLEHSPSFKSRFFRFQICRTHDNIKVPRHNTPSFASQINMLKSQIKKNDIKELLIVDVGIFSGKTIHTLINIFNNSGLVTPIKHITTYLCRSEIKNKFNDVKLTTHLMFKDMYEWVDIHDFTPFGGKILKKVQKKSNPEAVPYLFPWSNGKGASLHFDPEFLSISRQLIKAFASLIKHLDLYNQNKPIKMEHLIKGGYSIPNDKGRSLSYKANTRLIHYLDMCIDEIAKEEKRKVLIFDMDGTLYKFNNNNGFIGSKLHEVVTNNAISYIKENKKCSLKTAKNIHLKGLSHRIGLSAYLADKFKVTRQEYFNKVWNIEPKGIIPLYSVAKYLKSIKQKSQYKCILLSSAPSIWVNKVLNFIHLETYFDDVYSAEDFNSKNQIFKMLSTRYSPKNCLSIGDQTKTDIIPAKKCGMKTYLVEGPEDLNVEAIGRHLP